MNAGLAAPCWKDLAVLMDNVANVNPNFPKQRRQSLLPHTSGRIAQHLRHETIQDGFIQV